MEKNISEYYKITENCNAHKNVSDFFRFKGLSFNAKGLGWGAGR